MSSAFDSFGQRPIAPNIYQEHSFTSSHPVKLFYFQYGFCKLSYRSRPSTAVGVPLLLPLSQQGASADDIKESNVGLFHRYNERVYN